MTDNVESDVKPEQTNKHTQAEDAPCFACSFFCMSRSKGRIAPNLSSLRIHDHTVCAKRFC